MDEDSKSKIFDLRKSKLLKLTATEYVRNKELKNIMYSNEVKNGKNSKTFEQNNSQSSCQQTTDVLSDHIEDQT